MATAAHAHGYDPDGADVLALWQGDVAAGTLPLGRCCRSVRFVTDHGNAQVTYQFPGEIMQALTLGEGTGPREVEIPAGVDSIRVVRFDDDSNFVLVTRVPRETP
jgi:hypothetical protein